MKERLWNVLLENTTRNQVEYFFFLINEVSSPVEIDSGGWSQNSGYEHFLLLQRTWIWISAPTW